MYLKESIRRILREETESGKYTKAIQGILEYFKNEDCVCDIDMWYDDEDDMYLVYLVFGTEELDDKFTSDGKFGYVRKKQKEVEETIKSYLPIKNIRVGSYGTPHCGWKSLNESEDNEEKKIQKNLKAIRTLLDTIDVDGLCEMWVEYNPEDGDYEIRSKTTRRYLDMSDMVRELGYIDDTLRSWGLKTYVYTPWYVENCEDEIEFLNESVPPQVRRRQEEFDRIFKHYRDAFIGHEYKSFKSFWNVTFEATMETLYHALFSKTVKDNDWEESAEYIENHLIKKYKDETKQMWEKKHHKRLNESDESKQERKFTKLLNNIEEYLNSNSYNSVVRFMVDYDEVMDDVIVNIFIDAEDAVKLGGGINSVIKKTGKKIMEDLSVFPFDFKYHIHFERPQLNESETKTNSSLHRLLNMLFDGFDNADYDWANYMCGMGECCDPYAIGFTLPDSDYDDYIFKLVDGEMYDDDGDYPKEFRDELPEPCYQQPNIKDPKFDTIVFYGLYAEEIEDYMGHPHNWNLDLLKIINKQFGCDAKRIIII
jgi:hypothetical protein